MDHFEQVSHQSKKIPRAVPKHSKPQWRPALSPAQGSVNPHLSTPSLYKLKAEKSGAVYGPEAAHLVRFLSLFPFPSSCLEKISSLREKENQRKGRGPEVTAAGDRPREVGHRPCRPELSGQCAVLVRVA